MPVDYPRRDKCTEAEIRKLLAEANRKPSKNTRSEDARKIVCNPFWCRATISDIEGGSKIPCKRAKKYGLYIYSIGLFLPLNRFNDIQEIEKLNETSVFESVLT
ncbi:hypothetical protein LA52FAK_14770 [Desulforhopalus sp. 52FAK]